MKLYIPVYILAMLVFAGIAQGQDMPPVADCGESLGLDSGLLHLIALRDQGMIVEDQMVQIGDDFGGNHWILLRDVGQTRWAVVEWLHDSWFTLCVISAGTGPTPEVLP